MANKPKIGLEYYPFEVDFFDDIKIRKLIKYQGCKATPVYTLLLCNIYRNGYYLRWDEELPFTISEKTGYEEAFVREVIKCCLQVDLFSKPMYENHKVLTSKGIQERYEKICWMLKRKMILSEFLLIPSEELRIKPEVIPIPSESIRQKKGKETKEKETKEKEREDQPPAPSPGDELFLKSIYDWVVSKGRKYYPLSAARCESEILKLQNSGKWTKEIDAKIFEKYLGKQMREEVVAMYRWHKKVGKVDKIKDWNAAMADWFSKEWFKEKLA